MSKITNIAVLCVSSFQSLIIFVGNTFTVFVFWIHRHKLKRTSFLLINLAVADLLVGLTDVLVIGTYAIPRHFATLEVKTHRIILNSFQAAFSATSVFFLVLISLERAYALIWPLRHRVTSTKTYIYSILIAWLAGITVGTLNLLLVLDGILYLQYYVVAYSVITVLSLVTICVSYLSIRTRLNHRGPAIDKTQNRQSVEQNVKLSKTLFIVIGASLSLWVPSLAFYIISCYLPPGFFPQVWSSIFTTLHLTNSFINPIIYSFRMPVFRETLKKLKNKVKIRKQSERYMVNAGS